MGLDIPGGLDVTLLDGTVASGGMPAKLACKTPRVTPILVTDGRTDSQKFRQLLRIVNKHKSTLVLEE